MPRKTDSNNPADWLFFASQDLAALRVLSAQQISYHLCESKLAEALEKILKAELISCGWFLERIHDLQKLIDELSTRQSEIVEDAQPLTEALAEAYFAERYPGFDLEDPDWDEFKAQLLQVEAIYARVHTKLNT